MPQLKSLASSLDLRAFARRTMTALALPAVALAWPAQAQAQAQEAPLERQHASILNFETANTLPKGTLRLWTGWHQTAPGNTLGTGNQVYFGGGDWAVSDRLTLSLQHSQFDDLVADPIAGGYPKFLLRNTALSAKVKLFERGPWAMAARASIEEFRLSSNFYASPEPNFEVFTVGSLHLPISYTASERLQFHVTPSVSVFPDQINGIPFYGTVAALGAGASYRLAPRWLGYGTVNVPLSGGNVIKSDGSIGKVPVWTLGTRYNFSPKVALGLFATNGMGATPATAITGFFPDADVPLFGAMLSYTPGRKQGWPANYRGLPGEPLSPRQRQLQLDGFTLPSANTLSAGRWLVSGWGGSQGSWGGQVQFSPDHDMQFEAGYEQFANDGTVGPGQLRNLTARYNIGLRLRFMDQANGSPFSFAVQTRIGRDSSRLKTGVLYVTTPVTWQASDRLALTIAPKAAAFASVRKYGLGLGVNYALSDQVSLLGEATLINDGDPVVWAAGLRASPRRMPLHLDLHATNAVGRMGLGTMVGQSETKLSLTATLDFQRR